MIRLQSDMVLLKKLFSGNSTSEYAWKEFLRRYSNLFLKIIWQTEHDHDRVMDKYLFVCTKLSTNNFAVLKKFQPETKEHQPKLSTWLTVVVKNLCIEEHRTLHGRLRYPAALLRLSDFDRCVFKLYYWKGYSREEIEHHLAGREKNDISVAESLMKIERVVKDEDSVAAQQPRYIPYDESNGTMNEPALQNEELFEPQWFDDAVMRLPDQERVVIRMRFWEGMTAREISDLLRINPQRKIYTIIENALKTLRQFAQQHLEA
ncbi:MAG: sigma-70 family RNA polymerase sigma factor [Ignavibacteriae bacterium]|nr:sigma-70 family RNA polymerase sigma factor [Ignavibacteriota bacterium]